MAQRGMSVQVMHPDVQVAKGDLPRMSDSKPVMTGLTPER